MYKDLHKKLNHMAAAANHLRLAAEQLAAVRMTNDTYMNDDAAHYVDIIESVLSSDNGAAGIDALIRKLQERLSISKGETHE